MPSLIAHRGFPHRYPENTLAAIMAAIDSGARYVEVDVQLSADGVPVVFHDNALQRLCGNSGCITELAISKVRQLRVGGEPVPTLSELADYLQHHPDVHVFVELKQESINEVGEPAFLSAVIAVLGQVRSQCTLISFNAEVIRLSMAQGWTSGWVTEFWPETLPEGLEQGLNIVFCNVVALPNGLHLDKLGVPAAMYEVSSPELAFELAERGAMYIETNDIAGMRRALPGWT